MVRKIAIYTIAGAMLIANVQSGEATSLTGLAGALELPSGEKQFLPTSSTSLEPFSGTSIRSIKILNNSASLIAYDPFNATNFKTAFDRDPQFFAQATRMNPFWQFLIENDIIGMPQEKVVEQNLEPVEALTFYQQRLPERKSSPRYFSSSTKGEKLLDGGSSAARTNIQLLIRKACTELTCLLDGCRKT
jgi:hypothetical protein